MNTEKSQNTNEQINTLFRKVITMATVDAFDFLNSVKEPPEIVEQVVKLLSDSETRITFLANNPDLENILQPIAEDKDLIGQSIGDIDLVQLLGKGGMGEVYLGEDKQLKRKVAVKTIRSIYRLNHDARDRFRREALILSKLDHVNICKIYNILEIGDIDFLILEYIEGLSLNKIQVIDYSYQQKLKIAKALFAGLIVAHKEDIVHRDIKPDNIIIAKSGDVKILDFGISSSLKQMQNFKGTDPNLDSHDFNSSINIVTTNPGTILGTLGYMSPEQAKGEDVNTASDIYSLGIILHELFSGNRAHPKGASMLKLFDRTKKGISEPLLNTPKDLAKLINRMKSAKPALRPTAIDGAAMLDKIIDKPKRRMKYLLIALLILASILSFSKYTYDLNQHKQQAELATVEAEQVTEFLASLFKVSNPYDSDGKILNAREMLDDGAIRINKELEGQPRSLTILKMTIAEVYIQLGFYEDARVQVDEAIEIYELNNLNDAELKIKLLSTKVPLEYATRQFDSMEQLLLELFSLIEENNLIDTPYYLDVKFNMAVVESSRGNMDKALPIFLQLLADYQKDTNQYNMKIVELYNSLSILYWRNKEMELAEETMYKALAILRQPEYKNLEFESIITGNLTTLLSNKKKYPQAIEVGLENVRLREELLGKKHPYLAMSYDNLAAVYCAAKQIELCMQWNSKSLKIHEMTKGKKHHDYVLTLANRAYILGLKNDLDGAKIALLESIDLLTTLHDGKHHKIGDYLTRLSKIHHKQNNHVEEKENLIKAIEFYNKIERPMKNDVINTWQALVSVYVEDDNTELILQTYKNMLLKLENEENKDSELIKETKAHIIEYSDNNNPAA